MTIRAASLIALCAALAACNSKSSKPADLPAENASQAAANATASAAPVVPAEAVKPAPEGLPSRVARETIAASGQKCDSVAKAERGADGSIVASCTGGERYRVYTVDGKGAVATAL